jgi:hypothetical protein
MFLCNQIRKTYKVDGTIVVKRLKGVVLGCSVGLILFCSVKKRETAITFGRDT